MERIEIMLQSGLDAVLVKDLTGTAVKTVAVDFGGGGDGEIDLVQARGTAGDDRIAIVGTQGSMTVSGLAASVTNAEALDNLLIAGGDGADVLDASGATAGGIGLIDKSEAGDDYMYGSAGRDSMDGGDGADFLQAGQGEDSMEGGAGRDTLAMTMSAANDTVAIRTSEIQIGTDTTLAVTGLERLELRSGDGLDRIEIGDLSISTLRELTIDLGGQADRVRMAGTNLTDTVAMAQSGTTVTVTGLPAQITIANLDTALDQIELMAGFGNDVVSAVGMISGVRIEGNAESDVLTGGAGADQLFGGSGFDKLTGGGGSDLFIFSDINGFDAVLDFQNGTDRISITGYGGVLDAFADLAGDIRQIDGGVIVDLSANAANAGTIFLQGIQVFQLDASDFLFG